MKCSEIVLKLLHYCIVCVQLLLSYYKLYIAILRIRIDCHVISLWSLDLVFLNVSYENLYLFIQVTSILASGSIVDMSLCKVGNVCQQALVQSVFFF